MDEVEKLKAVNANLEQRKEELVKELEQVDPPWTLDHTKDQKVIFSRIRVWAFRLDYQPKRLKIKLERLEKFRVTFTPNGKRELVPRDHVFPWIVAYCLLLLHKNKYFHARFIQRNCSGQFLWAYFLFWEILNFNLTFVVCRKRDS